MNTKYNNENKLSKHDRKVLEIARAKQRKGCNIKADLPGFSKPDKIGRSKRIPDIQAKKNGRTTLIEVETPRSMKTDRNQRRTFRNYAKKTPRTSFQVVKTSDRKRASRPRTSKPSTRKFLIGFMVLLTIFLLLNSMRTSFAYTQSQSFDFNRTSTEVTVYATISDTYLSTGTHTIQLTIYLDFLDPDCEDIHKMMIYLYMDNEEDYTYEFDDYHEENDWRLSSNDESASIAVDFDYNESWKECKLKIKVSLKENKSGIDPTRTSDTIEFFTLNPSSERPTYTPDNDDEYSYLAFSPFIPIAGLFLLAIHRKNHLRVIR